MRLVKGHPAWERVNSKLVNRPLRLPIGELFRYSIRYRDPIRTVMVRSEGTGVDMFRCVRDKRFIMLWNAEFAMGGVIRRKESIEKSVEFPFAYITDIANFHRAI